MTLESTKNSKTPGNDGLIKEFFKTFWDELKTSLVESINWAFYTKILRISQRQAVIKPNEKKDHDKGCIKNFGPFFY